MAYFSRRFASQLVMLAAAGLLANSAPAQAALRASAGEPETKASEAPDLTQVAVMVRRGGVAVARPVRPAMRPVRPALRPGSPAMRPIRPALRPVAPALRPVRPALRPVPGMRWARPGWYNWRPGGAIAAGVALGFIAAASAAAYATSPAPEPGMCWYYTDPSRTAGFWDYCP